MSDTPPISHQGDTAWLADPEQQPDITTSRLQTPFKHYSHDGDDLYSSQAGYPFFTVSSHINTYDVNQGLVGDCVLESQLASLAEHNPDFIRDDIRQSTDSNGNRIFLVGFDTIGANGGTDTDGSGKVWVAVNDELPVNLTDIYNKPGAAGGIWASIIEKAAAKFWQFEGKGEGYSALDGFYDGQITGALTGTDSVQYTYFTNSSNSDEIWSALQAANSSHTVVTASTVDDVHWYSGLPSFGSVPNHDYTVLSTSTGDNGEKYVFVRNPWGWNPGGMSGHPEYLGNGTVKLSLADFQANFAGNDTGHVNVSAVPYSQSQMPVVRMPLSHNSEDNG